MAPKMSTTMRAFYALALAAVVSAEVVINNGCSETIHIDHVGPSIPDALPSFDLPAGSTLVQPFHGGGAGISVKIAREGASSGDGVLQLEYSLADHLYWDLSDLDGGGAGVVTSPFRDAHVRVTPTGNGANQGQNKCFTLDCPAGQTCQEAYQDPNQDATRVCPADTGDLILDLCLGGAVAETAPAPAAEDEAGPAPEVVAAATSATAAWEPDERQVEDRADSTGRGKTSRKGRGRMMSRRRGT